MSLGGECRRLLRQRAVKLYRKHLAQALSLCLERECGNDGLQEAHHDRAARFGICKAARAKVEDLGWIDRADGAAVRRALAVWLVDPE